MALMNLSGSDNLRIITGRASTATRSKAFAQSSKIMCKLWCLRASTSSNSWASRRRGPQVALPFLKPYC
eukprot:13662431-Alexandrium_andersonii.AAC.1